MTSEPIGKTMLTKKYCLKLGGDITAEMSASLYKET